MFIQDLFMFCLADLEIFFFCFFFTPHFLPAYMCILFIKNSINGYLGDSRGWWAEAGVIITMIIILESYAVHIMYLPLWCSRHLSKEENFQICESCFNCKADLCCTISGFRRCATYSAVTARNTVVIPSLSGMSYWVLLLTLHNTHRTYEFMYHMNDEAISVFLKVTNVKTTSLTHTLLIRNTRAWVQCAWPLVHLAWPLVHLA